MGKKYGLNFDGIAELSEKIEELGGDLREIATDALAFIPDEVNPKLKAAIAKHRRTGKTAASIVTDQKVQWQGMVASIDVGFNLKKGGLASIFLMYGTPRHAPRNQYGGSVRPGAREHPGTKADKDLYDAIYGTRAQKEIKEKQQEIFTDTIKKALK